MASTLPTTMTAAMVTEFNKPLQIIKDAPVPTPKGTQILVKVNACSLCMSDIAGWLGYLGPAAPIPYCAGHEPVGVVVGLSDNPVPNFKIGDRVGFMPASKTCQDCRACVSGNQRYWPSRINVGFNGPFGGFSEYALADPVSTVKIPNEIPDDQAAPFLCAGVTAYSAVKKVASRIPGGSLVNIVGSGGVGHLAIQYAVAMGYTVQAFDIAEDKLELAKQCGASFVVNGSDKDAVAKAPKALVTIVISGAVPAYLLGVNVTDVTGAVIGVGAPHEPVPFNVTQLIMSEISLITTNQGSRQELIESLELAAKKGIKCIISLRNISQVNEGIQDILQGKVTGRLVYRFD